MITALMIVAWGALGMLGLALLVSAVYDEDEQWLRDREDDDSLGDR